MLSSSTRTFLLSVKSLKCTYFDKFLKCNVGLQERFVQLQSVIVTRAKSTVDRFHSLAHCSAKLHAHFNIQQSNRRYHTSPGLYNPTTGTTPFAADRPHRLRVEIFRILFALAWHLVY